MHVNRVVLTRILPERSTPVFTAKLVDHNGNAIPMGNLNSLTMTLYAPNVFGKPLINNVENRNILNTNQGVIDSAGNLTITLTEDDMKVLSPQGSAPEVHRVLLKWRYLNDTKGASQEIEFQVANIDMIFP
jgi:hypothetical protein